MDNFEKNIRANKESFNDLKADKDKMWAAIAVELEQPKVIPLWKSPMLQIAASIVLFLGLGAFMALSVLGPSNNEETQYATKELLDIEMHYKNLISHQVKLVQKHPKLTHEDKTEFLSFMDELDQEYKQLCLEMQNNLDNEVVLEAIVSNYKKRIELIENLLKQINDSKVKDHDYGYTL